VIDVCGKVGQRGLTYNIPPTSKQGAFRSFLAGKKTTHIISTLSHNKHLPSNSSNLMANDAIDVTPLPRGLEIAIFKAVSFHTK